ncbi:hypothetical protein Tco_0060001 [Tanacetum coccineum]
MTKVDHADVIEESIQANVFNEVKNQLPMLLPQAVLDFVKPIMESTVHNVLQKNPINLFKTSSSSTLIDSFTKLGLKNMLYDKVQQSGSFNEHEKHLDLYNALIGSIQLDEPIAKGEIDPTNDRAGLSKKGKAKSQSSKTAKSVNAEETVEEPTQEVIIDVEEPVEDELVNVEEHPKDDSDPKQDKSTRTELFVKNRLKKDKITKADFQGPTLKLLKGTCKNIIELEYNMKQCLAGHLIIPVDFFFNNDLEYLKTGNAKRKCAASVTKTKATRYDLIGIEDMIPKLWSTVKEAYDKNVILSVIRLSIDKQFGYGYLKEIVIRRAYHKEYTFREADFSSLHLNDIEDMFLLYVQHKIHNLTGDEIIALVNALHMFSRSIVIQRRVEDVQLGVESYQKKLNITRPQTSYDGISFKEPYTIIYKPRGVVYLNKSKWKRLMRADELYKFSDGALKSVHDMLNNFVLGYNHDMPKRA